MNPVLSKLTMCVCAAGTGAAIIPAAHVVKRHFRPAVHHVARGPLVDAAAARPDCLPGVTLAGGGLPGGAGGGGGSSLTNLAPGAPGGESGGGFPFGGFGPALSGGGGGGFPGGGGGGGGSGGGGGGGLPGGGGTPGGGTPGGGVPGGGGGVTPPGPPSTSNAPEPAAWVLMVAGFGLAGGAIRYHRVGRGARTA